MKTAPTRRPAFSSLAARLLAPALAAAALAGSQGAAQPAAIPPETLRAAEALRDQAVAGSRAATWVAGLTDFAGPRLAGSEGDQRGVEWALKTMAELGFANVRKESAPVTVWARGAESGEVTAPVRHPLALTALGGSVATPEGGVEAPVVEVESVDALDALVKANPDAVKGKIVFLSRRTERKSDGSGYGTAVSIRTQGALHAAPYGAVGVLIRSVSTSSNRLPHTGQMRYDDDATKARIPAAALSNPDADLLQRLLKKATPESPVRVRFSLMCGTKGPGESFNVVGEVPGREKPEEVVVLGAHLDSWDLGTGALDDGAGCGMVLEVARLVAASPRRPRRTLRVVLYANEENGLGGARAYAKAHANELEKHAAAFEADSGSGKPLGLSYAAGPGAEALLAAAMPLLKPLGAETLKTGSGGADISTLRPAGVPLLSIWQDSSDYFDHHHTANDTFDKVDPKSLDLATAALAAAAYVAADLPEPLPRLTEEQRKARPF